MVERKGGVDFYNILRNPLRRRILELLYENGEMSASELRRELNISMGTLYYHLDVLNPLIMQTPTRRYCLSDVGRRAVSTYFSDETLGIGKEKGGMGISEKLILTHFLNSLSTHPLLCLIASLPVAILYLLLLTANNVRPFILFLIPSTGNLINDLLWGIGNLLLLIVYFLLATALFFNPTRMGREILLLPPLIIVANIPTVIFLTYSWLVSSGIIPLFIPVRIVYIILALWQLFIYSSALNVLGINWDRALSVSLILSYINLLTLYTIGYNPFEQGVF